MSIVLVGSTSGSITLQEPAVAGTTVLDLPAVSGTILTTGSSGQSIPKAALPTGSVLQVVQGITPSFYTTTSSSSTATGYGLSITPTSSTSKILAMLTGDMDTGVANNQSIVTIRRGTTDLGAGSGGSIFSAANRMIGRIAVTYLDSPATTSSTTYNIYFQAGSGSAITWYGGSTLTLMEIAA
jgi:hypothetical protein